MNRKQEFSPQKMSQAERSIDDIGDELPFDLPYSEMEDIDEMWKMSDYDWDDEPKYLHSGDVLSLHELQSKVEVSDKASAEEKGKPGAPYWHNSRSVEESDRLEICWQHPAVLAENKYSYEVRYKEVHTQTWMRFNTESSQPKTTITNLKPGTGYIFKVRVLYNDSEGPFGPESTEIKTIQSPAMAMKTGLRVVSGNGVLPEQLALPLVEDTTEISKEAEIRGFSIGTENMQQLEKTIILVGATGSGKSTLVDGMVNYIYGVNWDNEFRFHIVELEEKETGKQKSKTESQTEYITVYTINPPDGSRLNFRLRIIDTPGFGDTRGIQHDKNLVKQIHHLFNGNGVGIHFLDAICFIAKAPDERLNAAQKYIFEQMLLLFGKDVEANICPLLTFADKQKPRVLQALSESQVPCEMWYGFNNSALFADNKEQGDRLTSMFWEMGKSSYSKFFCFLRNITPTSLTQTKDVLATRHKLEVTISELQEEVKLGIQKVSELEAEMKIFKEKEIAFRENKSFTYKVMETIPFKDIIQDGQNTTNCDFCKKTCHFPCIECQGNDKSKCKVMDWKGNCLQCMRRCTHAVHTNAKFRYSFVRVPEIRSRSDIVKKYKRADETHITHGIIQARMQEEISEKEDSIKWKMETVTELNNRLLKIALKPKQVSLLDYIELLIHQESNSTDPQRQDHLQVLYDIKGKITFQETVLQNRSNTSFLDDRMEKFSKDLSEAAIHNK